MPLQFQLINVPIGTGIDQDSHEFLIPPVKLASCTNARYTKNGAINKRFGYERLAASNNKRLFSFDGALYGISDNGGTIKVQPHPTDGLGWLDTITWNYGNDLPAANVTTRHRIVRDGAVPAHNADCIIISGQKIVCWENRPAGANPKIRAAVFDASNGATVVGEATISDANDGETPSIIQISTTEALILYHNVGQPTRIMGVLYDTSTRTFAAASLLISDYSQHVNGGRNFDIAEIVGSSPRAWVTIHRRATPDFRVHRWEGVSVTHTATIVENPAAVGIWASAAVAGDDVWIGWFVPATPAVRAAALSPTDLTTVAAAFNVDTVGLGTRDVMHITMHKLGTAVAYMLFDLETQVVNNAPPTADSVSLQEVRAFLLNDSGSATDKLTLFGYELHSRIWLDAETLRYQVVARLGGEAMAQDCYYVLDIGNGGASDREFAANIQFARSEAGASRAWSTLAGVTFTSGGEAVVALNPAEKFLNVNGIFAENPLSGVDTLQFSYTSEKRWATATLGRMTYIACGVLMATDGKLLAEVGFHSDPSNSIMQAEGLGAGFLSAGSYQWQAVYEYTWPNGEREFSTPAVVRTLGLATSLTVIALESVDINLQNCYLTRKSLPLATALTTKHRAVQIHVYRTEANGTIFYKDTSDGDPPVSHIDGGTGTIFTSTQADADIRDNEQIYTTGGVLEHVMPPPCTVLTAHKNRLFLVNDEDPKTIWFSKVHVEGEIPGFNEVLQIRVGDEGAITALASLDDKLLIFKENAIWVLYGDGPDDKGENNTFSEPQRLNTEIGCTDWRSVAVIPDGVIFRATPGFYLVDRKLNVHFIGEEIIDTTANLPNTTSAVVLPNEREVRFTATVATPDPSTGAILVYDYATKAWIVDLININAGELSVPSAPFISAVLHNDTYHLAGYQGHNLRETGAWEDPDDQPIVTSFVTAWIAPSGLQGYARCRNIMALGQNRGAHALTMILDANYQNSGAFQSAHDWTSTEITAMARYQPRIHVPHQKAQSFRISVFDAPTGSGTQGFVMTGFAFDVGTIPTRMRTTEAHTQ